MRAVLVGRDLMLASRVYAAATAADAQIERLDSIEQLPPPETLDLVLVDWSERGDSWGALPTNPVLEASAATDEELIRGVGRGGWGAP